VAYEGLPYPQGDPGAAEGAAARLAGLAAQVSAVAAAVGTGTPRSWQGKAAAVYGETVRVVATSLSGGLDALNGAAAAARRAGQALEEAQQEVEQLARRVRRAREEAEIAERDAVAAEREAEAADSRAQQAASATTMLVSGAGSPFGPMPGTAERLAAARAHEHAVRLRGRAANIRKEFLEDRRRATRQATDACDDVKRADRSAAATVSSADCAAPAAAVPNAVRGYAVGGGTYKGQDAFQGVLTAADAAGGGFGGALEHHASIVKATATTFGQQARLDLELARKANAGHLPGGRSEFYERVDAAARRGSSAADLASTAKDSARNGKTLPLKVGGGLAVAGIGYDIHQGKDPVQAVAAGGGGFAASVGAGMATGMAIGTFVPVPGVGTAAGAVVGAAVGVMTSGAINSVFEEGANVREAASAGLKAGTDTAKALGGAIGGLFD